MIHLRYVSDPKATVCGAPPLSTISLWHYTRHDDHVARLRHVPGGICPACERVLRQTGSPALRPRVQEGQA